MGDFQQKQNVQEFVFDTMKLIYQILKLGTPLYQYSRKNYFDS